MAYSSYEELEVWQRSCQLAVELYLRLKDCRDFGLKDQMTRAAVSIASNIAEGAERGSTADFIRFLHIAKGSAAELRTQIYIASEIGGFSYEKSKQLISDLKRLSGMLHGLIKSLQT
ncbi:MAG: four helix bundle protein [Desulfobacteraceae bacterium]|jgi:four helix bundle protein